MKSPPSNIPQYLIDHAGFCVWQYEKDKDRITKVAENEGGEPKEIRNARLAGISKRKHSKRVLGCCGKWYINPYHNK